MNSKKYNPSDLVRCDLIGNEVHLIFECPEKEMESIFGALALGMALTIPTDQELFQVCYDVGREVLQKKQK